MAHKTKAAMPGRQCNNTKHIQDTRLAAGGQSLGAPEITGTAPLARLGGMPVVGPTPFESTNFSAHLQTTQKLGCLGCTALAHTPFPQIWGELDQRSGCTAMQHTPEKSRSFDRYPDIGYHSLSASLDFLRWRRLISPFTAVTMNCAFVSPSSRLLSKSATTSCGKRALSCCDLLLVEPVAIPESPCARCDSVYVKKIIVKGLKCDSLACSFKNKGAIHLVSAKPGSASTLTGPLTKPLVEVTVMAELQHTQTHPKFTWLFLATPKSHPDCSPVVLRFDTDTEENARAAFPGWEMVFAAKIRAEAPCRVAFFDYNTRRGWAFDSASDREVVGHD